MQMKVMQMSSEHKNLKEFSTRVAIFSSVILYVKISFSYHYHFGEHFGAFSGQSGEFGQLKYILGQWNFELLRL